MHGCSISSTSKYVLFLIWFFLSFFLWHWSVKDRDEIAFAFFSPKWHAEHAVVRNQMGVQMRGKKKPNWATNKKNYAKYMTVSLSLSPSYTNDTVHTNLLFDIDSMFRKSPPASSSYLCDWKSSHFSHCPLPTTIKFSWFIIFFSVLFAQLCSDSLSKVLCVVFFIFLFAQHWINRTGESVKENRP